MRSYWYYIQHTGHKSIKGNSKFLILLLTNWFRDGVIIFGMTYSIHVVATTRWGRQQISSLRGFRKISAIDLNQLRLSNRVVGYICVLLWTCWVRGEGVKSKFNIGNLVHNHHMLQWEGYHFLPISMRYWYLFYIYVPSMHPSVNTWNANLCIHPVDFLLRFALLRVTTYKGRVEW